MLTNIRIWPQNDSQWLHMMNERIKTECRRHRNLTSKTQGVYVSIVGFVTDPGQEGFLRHATLLVQLSAIYSMAMTLMSS